VLVITRRENEAIRIGSDIEVVITRVQGGKARVGIIAPAATRVVRAETDTDGRTVTAKSRPKI
jgi:carbon storage regulator CsrA